MAQPVTPSPVKLLCGMISADRRLFDKAVEHLTDAFGPVDLASDVLAFDLTHYYDDEMGSPLYKQFVSFTELTPADSLLRAKLTTNAIEADFSAMVKTHPRPINLDPGYIEPSKLVLASMKNFSHRIYLGSGVYAEITLQYRQGRWCKLPWTFPDFASGRYDAFLSAVRDLLPHGKPNPNNAGPSADPLETQS